MARFAEAISRAKTVVDSYKNEFPEMNERAFADLKYLLVRYFGHHYQIVIRRQRIDLGMIQKLDHLFLNTYKLRTMPTEPSLLDERREEVHPIFISLFNLLLEIEQQHNLNERIEAFEQLVRVTYGDEFWSKLLELFKQYLTYFAVDEEQETEEQRAKKILYEQFCRYNSSEPGVIEAKQLLPVFRTIFSLMHWNKQMLNDVYL